MYIYIRHIQREMFLKHLKKRLCDQYQQIFFSSLNPGIDTEHPLPKLRTYGKFKTEYKMEDYLKCVKNFKYRKVLSKLRLSNHRLRIETGRFINEPPENRICIYCNTQSVENEEHFLVQCPAYNHFRSNLPYSFSLTYNTLQYLFNPEADVAEHICKYVYTLFVHRQPLH